MLRPWLIALAAAACGVMAVVLPRGAWADDIRVDMPSGPGQEVDTSQLTIRIDDRRVVLHAPPGYAIAGWGSGDDEVVVTLVADAGTEVVNVQVTAGRQEDVVSRRGVVVREVVPGATMMLRSRRAPIEVLTGMLDALEIS